MTEIERHNYNSQNKLRSRVSAEEHQLLMRLRDRKPAQHPPQARPTLGERISDVVAATVGSWKFIIIQSTLLVVWLILNIIAGINHWDPYPFILLNLMLSFQAAYTAPIIMMSQNRQAIIDRLEAKHDYEINMKSELEIELLHDKINQLQAGEILKITQMLQQQQQQLKQLETLLLEQATLVNNNYKERQDDLA